MLFLNAISSNNSVNQDSKHRVGECLLLLFHASALYTNTNHGTALGNQKFTRPWIMCDDFRVVKSCSLVDGSNTWIELFN